MNHWTIASDGSLSFRSHELTLSLESPNLQVGEGILSVSNLISCETDTRESEIAIVYHWQLEQRAFRGEALLSPCGPGFVWSFKVFPLDLKPWRLTCSSEGSGWISGWVCADDLRLFHADNIRGVTQEKPLFEGTYFVSMSEWLQPLNAGRWQSFPGLWISEAGSERSFVSGVLSQNVWKHVVRKKTVAADTLAWEGAMVSPGIDAKEFASGEACLSEPIYLEILEAKTPTEAFQGYLSALEQRLAPSKDRSFLTHSAFWDSWNDRQPSFWDVSIDLVRRTAQVLESYFPTVRSLEIDDGYAFAGFQEVLSDAWSNLEQGIDPTAQKTIRKVRRLGAGFLYEPDMAIARDRFPNGPEEASAFIRAAGYLPAIWLGLGIVKDSAIIKDHPEWFVPYAAGEGHDPELSSVFGPAAGNRQYILDPSIPEVRAYFVQIFEVLFLRWGFAALKLDFWSYAFENDGFRLSRGERTAFEWRQWLFETIRQYLPEQTYFVIGCDISTGNPFLCPWVDNVRYGIDIGNGRWESIRYSALAGTFLLHVEANRFYHLNADSIGTLQKLAEGERQCFLAWCAVTRSLCEIAGDLSEKSREQLRLLQKLLLAPKNGGVVRLGESSHLSQAEPASIIFSPGDLFSESSKEFCPEGVLAVFNWSDDPRTITVDLSAFGLSVAGAYLDMDFFTDLPCRRESGRWSAHMPPRSVRLSQITAAQDAPRIVESHWTLRKAANERERLALEFHGCDPQGFCLYWPRETTPAVAHSNLPCEAISLGYSIYRISPDCADSLQAWKITLCLSPREPASNAKTFSATL